MLSVLLLLLSVLLLLLLSVLLLLLLSVLLSVLLRLLLLHHAGHSLAHPPILV